MVASLFAWRAGCIERRSNAAPTSAFTLYDFPTMAKRHSLGYVDLNAWIAAVPAQGARSLPSIPELRASRLACLLKVGR